MTDNDLAVFVRGNRNYIQGTQIIARCSECCGGANTKLFDATFHSITQNVVSCIETKCTLETDDIIGVVRFLDDGVIREFHIRDTGKPAPQRETGMDIEIVRQTGATHELATYRYGGAHQFEACLNVIVQATKDCHSLQPGCLQDIWLTGIRRFELPLNWSGTMAKGTLVIQRVRSLVDEVGGRQQTLSRVTMTGADEEESVTGFVTFVFSKKND